jgi:hypothetical protein
MQHINQARDAYINHHAALARLKFDRALEATSTAESLRRVHMLDLASEYERSADELFAAADRHVQCQVDALEAPAAH